MKNAKFILPALLLPLLAGAGDLCAAPARESRLSPLADSLRPVRKSPARATREAFRSFVKKHGKGWKVRYNPRTAIPEAITGGRTARYPGTPEQAAAAFFEDNKELLKVDPRSLRLALKREFLGLTHLQYQQYKDGIPVEFSYARVHVAADGQVSGYQGKFEPDLALDTAPRIPEQAAVMAASAELGRQLKVSKTELVIYPDEAAGELKLAWKIRGRSNGLWVYYVDASDGSVLFKYDDLRYICNNDAAYDTRGTSSGAVYEVSPRPGYDNSDLPDITEDLWNPPVAKSLPDQYFWSGGYSSMTVTTQAGEYCTGNGPVLGVGVGDGKVFSSLKGPYFSVTNFRGASAHFDNGAGTWTYVTNVVQTPHPYENSKTYPAYAISVPDTWTGSGQRFAKVMPRFTSFSAGSLDVTGTVEDADLVSVKSGNATLGAYMGVRTSPFFGAAVENPSYSVVLKTDESGTSDGFVIDISSYLVLTDAPTVPNNTTGSVYWSTTAVLSPRVYLDTGLGGANGLSEVNAFYHLNAIRRYFTPINKNTSGSAAADLTGQVPVMVHAHGAPDSLSGCSGGCHGMMNAYYDLEMGHIVMGDGRRDGNGKYRSFALDGTIVRHEYIHLVIDRIYPIINFGEFGAVSEAVADYFALASFWRDGHDGTPSQNQVTLGNFVGAGEGAARDLSGSNQPTGVRKMPVTWNDPVNRWYGEVHDDSLILSQALYRLGNPNGSRYLGPSLLTGTFAGQEAADVLVFAALFYFPDNFHNFRDAMLDACIQLEGAGCTSDMRTKIAGAFGDHLIGTYTGGDSYEGSPYTSLCDTNNGPECAVDISTISPLSATISPVGDVDYYSLPLAAGDFSARLNLPGKESEEGTYYAYSMFLFDSNREYLTEATPVIYGTGGNACPDEGQCYTQSPSVSLNYTVPAGGGRYYLVVSAAPNQYYGNSEANTTSRYTLTTTRATLGSAAARIYAAVYDNDVISFDVPYPYFPMSGSPSSSTLTGAELVFEYAQLRDHNYSPIIKRITDPAGTCNGTETKLAGSCMTHVVTALNVGPGNLDVFGRRQISSRVQLQPGFAARYPGIGTVYLEIFGRNHLGHITSMGVSNALSLAANRSAVTAYNNIIGEGGSAIIKYEAQSAGSLSVKVYTQAGTLVRTVYDGPILAGRGSLEWDGTNANGGKAASGIYFVKTKGPGLDKIVKIAVIR